MWVKYYRSSDTDVFTFSNLQVVKDQFPANTRHWTNVVLMLDQKMFSPTTLKSAPKSTHCHSNYYSLLISIARIFSSPGHHYVIKACRSKSRRHKFQTFVPKLVHFAFWSILGTMNNIFSTMILSLKKTLIKIALSTTTKLSIFS